MTDHLNSIADLPGLIARNPKGVRALEKLPDWLFERLSAQPEDVNVNDPYLVAILRTDIVEQIAIHLEIPF